MKETHDSLLLIDENGVVFRKRVPFELVLKNRELNNTRLLVKRILFEDETIILFEIDGKILHHTECEIIYEPKTMYIRKESFVYLILIKSKP